MASSSLFRDLSILLPFALVLLLVSPCNALASTDTTTWGGSNSRSGYETTHNMDPNVVGSAQFGLLWQTLLPGTWKGSPEQIYASPLTYTGSDGIQYVYVATQQNNVYKLNAKTGAIVASRNLGRPFLVTDLDGCNDIQPVIGITATGVIDAATGVWYMTSKTYADPSPNGATGRPNARYYIHALSIVDLSEMPNYPVNLEYTVARNNPARWFTGGIHHQRPALLMQGNYIYAGFASHCILYNYTGWIIGWNKGTGRLVEQYATEGLGVGPTTPGAGVWMSGGGLSADDKGSMYFATGNGNAYLLGEKPVNGYNPPVTLEEAVVHATINVDGSINLNDFFMPWEKTQLDQADKDLGTTPFQLLPSQFSCGNVQRIGMVTGKSGKTYWLNVDNLGGYRNGPNMLDNIIQSYQHPNIVYSSAGVYPLEGGYVYINVVGYPTQVFQFSCNNGVPYFNPIAVSPDTNSATLGVGHGTTTSLNGQSGTGLFWVSDIQGGNLRVYKAVPQNGQLVPVAAFQSPGTTKFTKLSFGDGVVFQGSYNGVLYAYGSPVNVPFSCTPVQFGTVNTQSVSSPQTVQCQAKTDLTVTAATLADTTNFKLQGLSASSFPLFVPQGQNLSLQATFTPVTVGALSAPITLNTTQGASGYTSVSTVTLMGYGQSQAPLLRVSPPIVTWNGVITGATPGGVNQSVVFSNRGNTPITNLNIQFSLVGEKGPFVAMNITAGATQASAFTFYGLPSSIPPNTDLTIPINFNPPSSGPYSAYMQVTSDGGNAIFDTLATGLDNPAVLIEFQNSNGTWTPYQTGKPFSFGNVPMGTTQFLQMRLTNTGGSNAAAIDMTVSKPPVALSGQMIGTNNQLDLAEGTSISAGQNKTSTLFCSPPAGQINTPSYNQTTGWTMNLNVPGFGHTVIPFYCNAVSSQYGPFAADGSVRYQYAGCYQEYNPYRQMPTMILSSDSMTNELCISKCSAAGWIFAGTEWKRECWCGMTRPLLVTSDVSCNYACSGNSSEVCGGTTSMAGYLSVFGDVSRWDGNTTNNPGPFLNPGTRGYVSMGCWTDTPGNLTLRTQKANANNTVDSCLKVCAGYQYAGVEYGGQCFCDNIIGGAGAQAALSDCSLGCKNNYTEFCGAASRLNLYSLAPVASTTTSTLTSTALSSTSISPSFTTSSLSTLSSTSTSLSVSMSTSTNPSSTLVSLTTSTSSTSSSTMNTVSTASLSTATTFTSGTAISSVTPSGSGSTTSVTSPSSMATSSTTDTNSAASAAMFRAAFSSTGATDANTAASVSMSGTTTPSTSTTSAISTSGSTSSPSVISSTSSTDSSTSSPSTSSSTSSSILFTSTSQTSTSQTDTSSTTPSFTSALSTSAQSTSTPSSSTPLASTPLTIASPATTTSSPPSSTSTPAIQYLGCAVDNSGSRSLSDAQITSNKMDIPTCQEFCASKNMPLSGIEYSTECYCGYTLKTGAPLNQSGCTMKCGGNSSQICGGSGRLSVYYNTAYTPTRNKPIVLGTSGKQFAYKGCYTDAPAARTLGGYLFTNATSMTVEMCVGTCQAMGYSVFGVEYGQECFCANSINTANGALKVDTDCNTVCSGDVTEWCGAANRINIWQSTSS